MKFYSVGSNKNGQLGLGSLIDTDCIQPVSLTETEILDATKREFKVGGGANHSLILQVNSFNIWGAGDNSFSQLGILESQECYRNFRLFRLPFIAIALYCGWNWTFLIDSENQVWSCGQNKSGVLGYRDVEKDTQSPWKRVYFLSNDINNVKEKHVPDNYTRSIESIKVAAGWNHTLFLVNGSVYASGHLEKTGLLLYSKEPIYEPILIDMKAKVLDLACGLYHSIFLLENYTIVVKGRNKYSQISVFNEQVIFDICKSIPISVFSGWSTCGFMTKTRNVYIWGRNDFGQAGTEILDSETPTDLDNTTRTTIKSISIPQKLKVPEEIEIVSLSTEFGYCSTINGELYSWGLNDHGTLGHGTTENIHVATKIQNFKIKGFGLGCGHAIFYS